MAFPIALDVLVVGAGNAGLCAALAAHESAAQVGIIEKAPRDHRGGNSALTAHMRFPFDRAGDLTVLINDPSAAEVKGIAERLPVRTQADLYDEIMRVTEGQSDQEMLQVHVGQAYPTIRWLRGKGMSWVPNLANPTAGDVIAMNGGGYGLQEFNFSLLERAGVPFSYGTSAVQLLVDQKGRVDGVRALTPDGFADIHARTVVLACGGFEGNPEMRARYLGARWDTVKNRGIPYNTGDGLTLALAAGAMPAGSWTSCHASPQDLNRPAYSLPWSMANGGLEWNRYAYPFGIMVNIHGERFVDEGEDIRARTYAKMGRAILAQPAGVAFEIFDAKARRRGLLIDYDKATGAKAGTLEELAGKLGTDPAGLAATVRAFNAAVQPGEANPHPFRTDGKRTAGIHPAKSNYAMPLDTPPYEGYAVTCGITFTFGGLKIDAKTAQVQHVAGRPFPGLYAAGEIVGGLWHWNYPSGSGMMAGAVFGRIAGIHAARAALA